MRATTTKTMMILPLALLAALSVFDTTLAFSVPSLPRPMSSSQQMVMAKTTRTTGDSLVAVVAAMTEGQSEAAESIKVAPRLSQQDQHQQLPSLEAKQDPLSVSSTTVSAVSLATLTMWTLSATAANAAGPDWGIFEGRIGSLLHPIMMFSMLALSLSTALLGFEWRRQRTMGDEISALKKSLPDLGGAATVADALAAAKAADTESIDTTRVATLQAALSAGTETKIKDLQSERKELAAKGPRDKHYAQGAWVAMLGTWFAIEGPLNTYARAGKLFPGPHLYAGAGLVALWALAVAAIPQMQKGSDTARYVHIGANISGIALFAWQVQSGIPILLKVIEFTKWP